MPELRQTGKVRAVQLGWTLRIDARSAPICGHPTLFAPVTVGTAAGVGRSGDQNSVDRKFMVPDRIVAVGLLTQRDLNMLGIGFTRAFPVDRTPCFGELLRAIDEADRELWRARDRGDQPRGD